MGWLPTVASLANHLTKRLTVAHCFKLEATSNKHSSLTNFIFSLLLLRSSGFEENLEVQGELILQDSFQVWDPRSLIRKGRDRHLFLFEFSLVFSKEIKDSAGRTKYQYKSRLLVRGRHCGPVTRSMREAESCLFLLPCRPLNWV